MQKYQQYTLYRFEESHIPDWIRLFEEVFGKKWTQKAVKQKYAHSKYSYLGFVAYSPENKLIASYTGVYREIYFQGISEKVLQSCDTMTHPAHQGRGLFPYLAELTYQLIQEQGFTAVFGFPNQNSFPTFTQKMQWKVADNFIGYEIKVSTLPLAAIFSKFSLIQPLFAMYVQIYMGLFYGKIGDSTALFNSFSGETYPVILRNFQKPNTFLIAVKDTLFWVKITNSLIIGDIKSRSCRDLAQAMQKLLWICRLCGIKTIYFQSLKGSETEAFFAKNYASFASLSLTYRNFSSQIPLQQLKATWGDVDTF